MCKFLDGASLSRNWRHLQVGMGINPAKPNHNYWFGLVLTKKKSNGLKTKPDRI
ncbi:hypothetical protein ACE6H2_014045 [Prunus campanulata]